MTAETIRIEDIDADEVNRLRPVDMVKAEAYAASIEQSGLIQPIVVRPVGGGKYKLTAGGHRLAAMKILGREELTLGSEVVVREDDDDSARQAEIFENVFNAGLSALDRVIFLFEGKKRWEAKRGETRGRKRKDVEFKEKEKMPEVGIISSERFTLAAAKKLGLSEALIKDACAIAERLDKEAVKTLRGTMIEDNAVELRLFSGLAHDHQRDAALKIKAGEAKTVLQAKQALGLAHIPQDDPQARILTALRENFEKASKPTRQSFMRSFGLVYDREAGKK